jgi:hypothetical protein
LSSRINKECEVACANDLLFLLLSWMFTFCSTVDGASLSHLLYLIVRVHSLHVKELIVVLATLVVCSQCESCQSILTRDWCGAEAVPKRILELMGVHGLTRENVASHLQVQMLLHLHTANLALFILWHQLQEIRLVTKHLVVFVDPWSPCKSS